MSVFECLARLRQAIERFVSYVILVGEMGGERPFCARSGPSAQLVWPLCARSELFSNILLKESNMCRDNLSSSTD